MSLSSKCSETQIAGAENFALTLLAKLLFPSVALVQCHSDHSVESNIVAQLNGFRNLGLCCKRVFPLIGINVRLIMYAMIYHPLRLEGMIRNVMDTFSNPRMCLLFPVSQPSVRMI